MTTTPAPGEPGNQTPLDALYWARPDPEGVRALIAEAEEHCASYDFDLLDEGTWPDTMRRLAAALSASIEAQRRLGVIADSAQDGLADSDDDHDMSALWVLTVATGQDEADTEPRPLASRTVETAEEWARDWANYFEHWGSHVGDDRPFDQRTVAAALRGPKPFGVSATVPPEEADQ